MSFFLAVLKGTSHNLMKPGAKRRRSKLEMKEEKQMEAQRKYEIADKLAKMAQMEELVLSLCKEADDALRRQRVESFFAKELSAAGTSIGDHPPRFANLFQVALERVGSSVQERARKQAIQEQEAQQAREENSPATVGSSDAVYAPREKSAEELQLWACVDIMVQSKMLVRRAIVAPEDDKLTK